MPSSGGRQKPGSTTRGTSLSFATGAIDSLPWLINTRPVSKGLHYKRV
jgi:hypothetical protein